MSRYNRTTIYLQPLLTNIYDKDMMTYLGINDKPDLNGFLYLTIPENNLIISELDKNLVYNGITFVNDRKVYEIQIDTEYLEDYFAFGIGAYYKIIHKDKILQYWKKHNDKVYNLLINLFYNKDQLKEAFSDIIGSQRDYHIIKPLIFNCKELDDKWKIEDEILYEIN